MRLHVSLHDVTPRFASEMRDALELCAEFGIRPALLVVPDHHEQAPLEDHPAFVEQLRELSARGHEIYLHGMHHRATAAGDDESHRAVRFFRQRVVSAGEAEFASLTRAEAAQRLGAGVARLRALGLPIDGFVAPAWSFRPWLLPMLAEHQIRYTEDHLRVYDPVAAQQRLSLVLNFASRSLSRIATTSAYCRLARPLGRLAPVRIALHPGDFRVALLRHEARSLLRWGRAHGDVVRGAELLH